MIVLKIKGCSVRMAQEINVKANEYVLRTSVDPCGRRVEGGVVCQLI